MGAKRPVSLSQNLSMPGSSLDGIAWCGHVACGAGRAGVEGGNAGLRAHEEAATLIVPLGAFGRFAGLRGFELNFKRLRVFKF